jgi:hypothetical protein
LSSVGFQRPIYTSDVIQRDVNLARARAGQAAAGQVARMRESLMGRGFGSNSPLAYALANNIQAQARAGAYQDETMRRMRAAEANAGQQFQYDQLRQQELLARLGLAGTLSQQELSAWNTQYTTAADLFNQAAARENALQLQREQAAAQFRLQYPSYGRRTFIAGGGYPGSSYDWSMYR